MHWRTEAAAHDEILRDPDSFGISQGSISAVVKLLDGELDTRERRVVFRRGGGIKEAVEYIRAQPGSARLFKGGEASRTAEGLPRSRAELVRRLDKANGVNETADILNKHAGIWKVMK